MDHDEDGSADHDGEGHGGDGPWRPGHGADDHGGDGHGEGGHDDEHDEAHEALEKGAKSAEEIASAIGKANDEDATGALEGGLGALGEGAGVVAALVDDEDAREAAEAVETVAELTKTGMEAVGHLAGHGGHEGGHEDSGDHTVSEAEARGEHGGHSADAVEHLGRSEVELHLRVEGQGEAWTVRSVSFSEGLNTVPVAIIVARYAGVVDAAELLDAECVLECMRTGTDERRHFRGVCYQAGTHELAGGGLEVQLHVTAAAAYLQHMVDSRIFQDYTVVDIIRAVYMDLGDMRRELRDDTQQDYEVREYVVQYQESSLAFIQRLAEESGIFFYFDMEEDGREVLVLADSVHGLANARSADGGRVAFGSSSGVSHEERVVEARHTEHVAATDAAVSAYDWTRPSVDIVGSQTSGSPWRPQLEVYDHTDALELHEYAGTQYTASTARHQARIRSERLEVARHRWELSTTVLGARPGTLLELTGAEDPALDQRYLIVSSSARGEATPGESGHWQASLEVVPVRLPFRPARRAPKPVIPGPETATVVGPADQEIHTDEHGRVKVRFHWDRGHARGDELSSCWMRVSQSWAGPGFGTFFLPRIGMEVVVSFLGGNPDRPLVTGCVYNGQNLARFADNLPANKTQSYIRTKSSLNSDGFNELRFEDKAGDEFIYTHAQKDYNEVVENNHSTHVKVDQSNTVDHDQTEHVGNDQKLTVDQNRIKVVAKNETNTIKGHRKTTIGEDGGDEELHVINTRKELVDGDLDQLQVSSGDKRTDVTDGKWNITTKGQFKVVQDGDNELYIQDCLYGAVVGRVQLKAGEGVHYDAEPNGRLTIRNREQLRTHSVDDQVHQSEANIKMQAGQKISLVAETEVLLKCGNSTIKLTRSGIEIAGPDIKINATSGVTEIDAQSQVKIKC